MTLSTLLGALALAVLLCAGIAVFVIVDLAGKIRSLQDRLGAFTERVEAANALEQAMAQNAEATAALKAAMAKNFETTDELKSAVARSTEAIAQLNTGSAAAANSDPAVSLKASIGDNAKATTQLKQVVNELKLIAYDAEFLARELGLHAQIVQNLPVNHGSRRQRLMDYLVAAGDALQSQHGHVAMARAVLALENRSPTSRKKLLEIGTTREVVYAQASSTKLALLCDIVGLDFITVDMDPTNKERLSARLCQISKSATAIASEGTAFLKETTDVFDYVYLDSFDFFHTQHSPTRVESYKANLKLEITDENSWAHHRDVAELLIQRMPSGGVIVLDDTWRDGDGWAGKGKLAVGLLREGGFETVFEGRTNLVLVKG